MLKFTGSALALLAAFSLMPIAQGEAGERHRIVKPNKFRMIDRSAVRHVHHDGRHVRRHAGRSVVVVKRDGDGHRHHRRHRHWNRYSEDVLIHVDNGIGPWSYVAFDPYAVYVAPSAKIIDVETLKPDSACEMEAGVCVIRP